MSLHSSLLRAGSLRPAPSRRSTGPVTPKRVLAALVAATSLLALPAAATAAPGPTDLKVTATGDKQVALSWTAIPGNATRFAIFRNGAAVPIATVDSGVTKFVDESLALGSTATYQVAAVGTDKSNSVTATTVPTTPISGCSATALPAGHYRLDADIDAPATASTPCITIGSPTTVASNSTLDCRNHFIKIRPGAPLALLLQKLSGHLLINCQIKTTDEVVRPTQKTVQIVSSPDGIVANSDMDRVGPFTVSHSARTLLTDTRLFGTNFKLSMSDGSMFVDNALEQNVVALQVSRNVYVGTGNRFKWVAGSLDYSPDSLVTGAAFDSSAFTFAYSARAQARNNTLTQSSLVGKGSPNLTIKSNTATGNWGYQAIEIGDSRDAVVDSNTVTNAAIQVHTSPNARILNNTLTAANSANVSLQLIVGRWKARNIKVGGTVEDPIFAPDPNYSPDPEGVGDNVIVQDNTVKGGWEYERDANGNYVLDEDGKRKILGVDDNILILGPIKGLVVQGNETVGSYDAGIETGNLITDSYFLGNEISNVEIAGIGAYHRTGWENNVVSGNTVTGAPKIFDLGTSDSSLVGGEQLDSFHDYPTGRTAFTFFGNIINDNTLKGATKPGTPGLSVYAELSMPERQNLIAHDNIVAGNDFGYTAAAPLITPKTTTTGTGPAPASTIIDAAQSDNNKCNPQVAPIVIQCLTVPIVTFGNNPTRVSSGSYVLSGTVNPNGLSTTTKVEWGIPGSFGSSVAGVTVAPGSSKIVPFLVNGLTPGQTYNYRVVATNADGVTVGTSRTFTAS